MTTLKYLTRNILFFLIISILITGCGKELLNPKDQNNISDEDLFNSANAVSSMLVACYGNSAQWHFYSDIMLMDEYGNNHINIGGDNTSKFALAGGLVTSTSDIMLNNWECVWQLHYKPIQSCNYLIQNESKIKNITETEKNIAIGEAKFLRAKSYYFLVNLFGNVPLLTKTFTDLNTDRFPFRDTIENVYQLIIDDLNFAVTNLPEQGVNQFNGHAKKGAAKALLAKVYMCAPSSKRDYIKAEALTNEIISSKVYDLEPIYKNLWTVEGVVKYNKSVECIYGSVLSNLGQLSGGNITYLSHPYPNGTWFFPRKPILALYDSLKDTVRLKASFLDNRRGKIATENPDWGLFFKRGYFLKKYLNTSWKREIIPANKGEYNNYFIRYADILLLRAEILNELNSGPTPEAINLVNQIRDRAKVRHLNASETSDKEAFIKTLIAEREVEFVFEGLRFFDLKRMGKALDYLVNFNSETGDVTSKFKEYQLLLPIPQYELLLNPNLKQNPGY